MDKVIDLLKEKNQYLEKFYNLNETEMVHFAEGNFENLENFYDSREGLLKMINKFDDLIEKATPEKVEQVEISPVFKKQMLGALSNKNELVTQILSQDLQILSFIEDAKSEIIRELKDVKSSKKAISGYKVGTSTKRLNEEY